MKLYVSPGACSMSCHIAFEEAALPVESIIAAWDDAACRDEIQRLNPQGAVPILVLDDGKVLTQNVAILTWVAERAQQSKLLPAAGTFERAQAYQWASWVASDLHKTIGQLFREGVSAEARQEIIQSVDALLVEADRHLEGKPFLVGDQFTIADAYLFTVYGWTRYLKIPTEKYRNINAYSARIAERPAVRAVMKREGLLK